MNARARALRRPIRIGVAVVVAIVAPLSSLRAHDPDPKDASKGLQQGVSAPAAGHDHGKTADKPGDHQHDKPGDHQHGSQDQDQAGGHVHAEVPPEYKAMHVPASAWTDPRMIARGKEIYATRCAVCHGDNGDGKGPAGLALPVKPPDLRDAKMIGEMTGNYWFWRISEGATVEPFKSMGSAMPAWKDELSVEDRWAVIAYQHTFSGHDGPHVTSEHPPMEMTAHGSHMPAPATAPAAAGSGHKH